MIYPRTPSCSGLSAAYRVMYGVRGVSRCSATSIPLGANDVRATRILGFTLSFPELHSQVRELAVPDTGERFRV